MSTTSHNYYAKAQQSHEPPTEHDRPPEHMIEHYYMDSSGRYIFETHVKDTTGLIKCMPEKEDEIN